MTNKELDLIVEIAKRAEKKHLIAYDRISLIMDLEVAHKQFNLKLENLLNADNFNFAHDIIGIQNNINRQTKQIENCFLPRFSN